MTHPPSPDDPAAPPSTTALGRTAEDLACRHLERAGLQCLTRNYRCRAGEIDLVMLEPADGVLVLVEVRSRSRRDYGTAASTIGVGKRRRFSLAARHLLMMRRELRGLRVRFDVVAIDPPAPGAGPAPQLTWLRNAFALT
jgi:putative endonuclease